MDHYVVLASLSQTSQPFPPQHVKISLPCISSPLQALLPLYGAHQLDNLGTALTVFNALLTYPSCEELLIRNSSTHGSTSVSLKDIITLKSVARGIKETKWPGRLSFHTVHLPSSPSTPNETPPLPFLVLADGDPDPASAKTLLVRDYITYLIDRTIVSTEEGTTTLSPLFPLDIPISTIEFGDIAVLTTISVGLLRFTPEGIPWIKCVPPPK